MASPRDSILDMLLEDPEFLELSDSDQDSLFDELVQDKTGEIPKTENVLQRAIGRSAEVAKSPQELSASFLAGGPSLTGIAVGAGQKEIEEGLPSALQLTGNIAGLSPQAGLSGLAGSPFVRGAIGGTIGRTIGEASRQGIRSLVRGEKLDPEGLGAEAGTAAVTEGVGALTGRGLSALFSGASGKFFQNQAGKVISAVKTEISKKVPSIPASSVLEKIRPIVEEANSSFSVTPRGRRAVNQFWSELNRVAEKSGGTFKVRDLFNMKTRVGNTLRDVGIFSEKSGGPKVEFNEGQALIQIRGVTDDIIKELARNVDPKLLGMFEKANSVFSAIAERFPKKAGAGKILPDILRAGAIMSFLEAPFSESPSKEVKRGTGALIASELVESRAGGKFAFRSLGAASRIAPTAVAELISQGRKRRKRKEL